MANQAVIRENDLLLDMRIDQNASDSEGKGDTKAVIGALVLCGAVYTTTCAVGALVII